MATGLLAQHRCLGELCPPGAQGESRRPRQRVGHGSRHPGAVGPAAGAKNTADRFGFTLGIPHAAETGEGKCETL